jgi:hypothetical protein
VFGGTPGAETVTPVPVRHLAGRVTGLCALGDAFVAASVHGDLADNTREWPGVLTDLHDWQPLAYAVDPTPGAGDGVDVRLCGGRPFRGGRVRDLEHEDRGGP